MNDFANFLAELSAQPGYVAGPLLRHLKRAERSCRVGKADAAQQIRTLLEAARFVKEMGCCSQKQLAVIEAIVSYRLRPVDACNIRLNTV